MENQLCLIVIIKKKNYIYNELINVIQKLSNFLSLFT